MQCYPSKQGYSSSEGKYSMSSSQHSSSHGGSHHGSSRGGGMMHHGSSAAMGGMHHGGQHQQHYGSSAGMGGGMHHGQHHHHGSSSVAMGGMDAMHHGSNGGMQIGHKASSYHQSSSHHQMLTVFGNDPFCEIAPSSFPPGTDPHVVQCFNRIDKNGNGVIDDIELQSVLSSCSQPFSLRTVHLLMYEFTHSNKRMIGPKEFLPLLNCLQSWKTMFQRFDRNRDGTIDSMELGSALNSLGYCVSPIIVNILIAKFTKSNGGRCSLKYDQFIECCLTVKGLTETFKARENCGKASFCYEEFLLNVLPFIVA